MAEAVDRQDDEGNGNKYEQGHNGTHGENQDQSQHKRQQLRKIVGQQIGDEILHHVDVVVDASHEITR